MINGSLCPIIKTYSKNSVYVLKYIHLFIYTYIKNLLDFNSNTSSQAIQVNCSKYLHK